MKKLISLFGILAISVSAMAADVNVQGGAKFYAPKDFDAGVGLSAKAVFPDVFVENLDLGTGIEVYPTQSDKTKKDLDLVILPVEAGYRFKILENLTVKPVVGLDLITGSEVDPGLGAHVGAELAVKTPIENLEGVASVGYQFGNVDVDNVKHDLSGVTAGAGVKYSW